LAGVRVVQAFRREQRTIEDYKPRSRAQIGAWRRASFVNIRLFTMIPLAQTTALFAVLLAAASMYRHGAISEGTIAAYVLYLVQLFDPIARFSEWLGDFRQGLAALGKIAGLLRTPNSIVEQAAAVELPGAGSLTLRDVTFGYDGERPAVLGVTVEFEPGEHVALDEATSSLDPATEAAVERALAALVAGRTVVTIARRLSTAERADRVVVMEHGRPVEVASHAELVEQGERYAQLWASWQAGLEP